MLFLTESDVRQLLPMDEAVRLTRRAFEHLAAGEALNHPRRRLIVPGGSVLHYMVGSDGKYFGAKVYATHPRHGAHFSFLLYRSEDAAMLAVMEANYLGQIRTGAATGFATDVMARQDADTLGLVGAGFQARGQLEAVAAVRRLRSVKVWSRSAEKRQAFARDYPNLAVEPVETAEAAVRGAGIVVTVTFAKDPVLDASWIAPGTHVNAVGSNQAKRRELPTDLMTRADLIAIDSREQARMESGDLILSLGETAWSDPRVVELAEIAAGRASARPGPDAITVFKSNGLAVEDVACAGFVYERAIEAGLGRTIDSDHS
ncbi:MAG TPA: ornithine cyclodeaminase family protein [Bryobacteraceae bacterium]|nr:ornithine cyclodeaminase family protein [Bryobacteraceae bacterium]